MAVVAVVSVKPSVALAPLPDGFADRGEVDGVVADAVDGAVCFIQLVVSRVPKNEIAAVVAKLSRRKFRDFFD